MRTIRPLYEALRIGGIYLAISLLWIVLSDRAVERLFEEMELQQRVQTWKGLGFVLITSSLLALLIYRSLSRASDLQSQLRAATDQNLAGLYVIQDGAFPYVNARVAEVLGYSQDEMTSMGVMTVVAPEDQDIVRENVRRRASGEIEDLRYRMTCVRKNGERIRAEVHGRRAEWRGKPAIVGVLLDVTELEVNEERERKAQRLMALGELTSAVAHDFNNLLTAIIAPIDLCLERLEPESPEREEVVEARESALRAVALTRQLLSFSRRRIFRPRPTDLGELVREMTPVLNRLSPGVQFELDLEQGLPAVDIDPSHFERVLLNLASNAVEALSGRGKVLIRTALESNRDQPRVILDVEDFGRGMDESVRARLFEPFFTTREDGTGLGLSTVHGIVLEAGGEITVESEPGVGTTFKIFLPASSEALGPVLKTGNGLEGVEPLGLPTHGAGGPEDPEALVGGTILLVDDENAVRLVTMRALERHGYQVLPVGTGADALAAIEKFPGRIDLALIDIGLPDIDGVSLAAQVLQRVPQTSILYTSGHFDERVVAQLSRERTAGFLEKPFSVQDLLDAVREGMRKGRE
jgi:PAS domain S-box-containing protein